MSFSRCGSSGTSQLLWRRVSVGLLVGLFGPLACSAVGDEGALDELSQAVKTYGSWSAYGNGQCVTGARTFYQSRYNVTLAATGAQPSSVGSCKYLGACMYWVSPKVRPSSAKWNRYEWGSVMPQTYDLVIYPPTSSNGYGHVASIDHLEGTDKKAYQKLYMMDSNFQSYEQKSTSIHTFNLKPYGFYRLKSLDGCKPRCDGASVVDKTCKVTKCADAQAKCVSDALGPHCVHTGCPASGTGSVCEGKKILGCKNGVATAKEDCSKDGSSCSKEKIGPHCVFPGCPASGKGEVCNDNQVVTCKDGDITAKSDCDKADSKCRSDGAGPHCVFPGCPSTGKGTLCEDKLTVASCSEGKIVGREDCGKNGSTCVKDAAGGHCVYPGCPAKGAATFCDDGGVVVTCLDGKATKRDDCAARGEVCSETGPLHCDAPPAGDLEEADCESLDGWAFDPSAAEAAIDVELAFDETPPDGEAEAAADSTIVVKKADGTRETPCGAAGKTSCAHTFAHGTPRSLLDGLPHEVHAYGLDTSGGPKTPLAHGTKTLLCAAPQPTGLLRPLANPETWENWAFSSFQDVAPLAGEAAPTPHGSYDEGPDLPIAPQFVRSDDGSAQVWSLDTGVRRPVKDAAALAAWRQAPAVLSAAQLKAIPEGGALPVRPRLFEDAEGALFVEDIAFLPEGMTGTPTGTEEGDDPPAIASGGRGGGSGRGSVASGSGGSRSDSRPIEVAAEPASGCAASAGTSRAAGEGLAGLGLGALALLLVRSRRR